METTDWTPSFLSEFPSILKRGLSAFFHAASHLAFPPTCDFCKEPLQDPGLSICPRCGSSVERIEAPICDLCGHQFDGIQSNERTICGSCKVKPPPYGKARYAVRYEGDLRKAFIAFKFHGALYLGRALGQFLIEAYRLHYTDATFDFIVPVPLHPGRLCSRGYNQVVILGERLSRASGIPLARTCLEKTENRPPQVGLSRGERAINVRGSFRVSRPSTIKEARILLIDDVATTGATVTEAASTIVRNGASRVDVLVLAFRPLLPTDTGADPKSIVPNQNSMNEMNSKSVIQ